MNATETRRQSPLPAPSAAVLDASPSQILKWLDTGEAVLIDVREPDEHAREHISAARLIPLSSFDPQVALAHAGKNQKLVLHCRGGKRASEACRMVAACAASGAKIFNMTGGLEAWKAEGLPVKTNSNVSRISIMRQVQLVVGLCVLISSVLAWLVHPAFLALAAFFGAGLTFAGATGICALASVLGMMPWNKAAASAQGSQSCAADGCCR